jgi:hypothetical protein
MLPLAEVSASELKTPIRPMNCASRMILLGGKRPKEPDCCPIGPCPWDTLSERELRALWIESVLDLSPAAKKTGC